MLLYIVVLHIADHKSAIESMLWFHKDSLHSIYSQNFSGMSCCQAGFYYCVLKIAHPSNEFNIGRTTTNKNPTNSLSVQFLQVSYTKKVY